MKRIIVLSLCLLFFSNSFGQRFYSDCEINDSIRQRLEYMCYQITINRLVEQNLPGKDSVLISETSIDTMILALNAIYNVRNQIASFDSISHYFNYPLIEGPSPEEILGITNQNLNWLTNLQNGIIPCGNDTVDSLMNLYDLSLGNAFSPSSNYFNFVSNHYYNTIALANLFSGLNGIASIEANKWTINGKSLKMNIHGQEVDLTFDYGWGDCSSGCMWMRHFEFNVNLEDCSVEFIKSYGTPTMSLSVNTIGNVKISPNPFDDFLIINQFQPPFSYTIYDLMGKKIDEGKNVMNKIILKSGLNRGVYFIQLENAQGKLTQKIEKK